MTPLELWPALVAGLVAGSAMELPVYVQKAMRRPVRQDIFQTWGSLFGLRGTSGYIAGIVFHEALAAAVAVGYAAWFHLVDVDGSLWFWGALGALVHYAVATVVVRFLPSRDSSTGEVGRQGVGYRRYGVRDVVTMFVGHLLFGVLTGIVYALLHSGGGPGLAF